MKKGRERAVKTKSTVSGFLKSSQPKVWKHIVFWVT